MIVSWVLRVLLAGSIYFFLWYVFRLSREEAYVLMGNGVTGDPVATALASSSRVGEEAVFQVILGEGRVFYKGAAVEDGENIAIDRRLGLGRSGNNELVIDNPHVSLHHAEIGLERGLWVRDLHSVNGTFVNQQKITRRTALKPGDKVVVGPLTLVFVR